MEKQYIEKELVTFIQQTILDESVKISPNDCLKDAGVDSFSIVEIILFIERKFDYAISEEMLLPENFYSVQTIAALINV